MSEQFVRKIEDFKCEWCGEEVKGDGYTNHCPKCLWSKHVDVFPGDRAATCQGLMKPLALETRSGEVTRILHRCLACGHEKANKVAKGDEIDPDKFIC